MSVKQHWVFAYLVITSQAPGRGALWCGRLSMMSKAWYKGPLRYLLMRAQLGWEETVAHMSGASVSDAIAKGYSVFQRDLTRTIFFTGEGSTGCVGVSICKHDCIACHASLRHLQTSWTS